MTLSDLWSDFLSAVSPTELHAEAPPATEEKNEEPTESKSEDSEESKADDESEDKEEDKEEEPEAADEEEEEEAEEEEEEEEEPQDPKPILEEECSRSAQCAPMKHHYDDCVKRVTAKEEDEDYKGPKEDCVEEFFHLSHCAAQCAAPKLFKMLK